ncbi:hypothetical protein P885DRAFT_63806 [Corynascus similis CBS 632.67]
MASEVCPTLPVPITGLVNHIAQHPDTPMVELLEPCRKYDAHIRRAFAQGSDNELLKDPYVNVLPLFTDDTHNIKIRARNLKAESEDEKSKYIMPLPPTMRRPDGSPAVVKSLQEFQRNFNIFCESSLSELNWSNVVAAGSSVVNTLLPVPEEYSGTKRGLRELYHEKFSPASDVDLFLYGLTEEQAIEKIKAIEASIRDAVFTGITVLRTKHPLTICSQYPTRHIQIVLRIYKTVSEILTGVDIDCSAAAYDGKQVYCTPRALQSYMTQINHIDLSRRSPPYENRLSKYSHRGFEVYFSELDRSRIDPTIFERSFQRTLGLARLLVLERLPTQQARDSYQNGRRRERGRPPIKRGHREIRVLRGNIKEGHEDEVADWFIDDISNYHTYTLPYGRRFTSKKIEKLCYTRDLLLNVEWNQPDNRSVYLHRHPTFFGRVEDVIRDCCGHCPVPNTDEEKRIFEQEKKVFISGGISFIKDDPGRQQIGSFNPLTEDDWTEMAYVGNTAQLFQAIVDEDLEHVVNWLAQEGSNPNTRDYTEIVKILLRKSVANEAEYEEKQDQRRRKGKALCADSGETESEIAVNAEQSDGELIDEFGSEDGATSMATGSFVKVGKKEAVTSENIADDGEDEPNFYDINVTAWDTPCSALHLAIVNGHVPVVQELVQEANQRQGANKEYGADVLLPVQLNNGNEAILTLVLALALPVEKAKDMVKILVSLGATSAQAGRTRITAFHRFVEANAESLLDSLWELDPIGTKSAINHIAFPTVYACDSPLQVALRQGNRDLIVKLLDHGTDPQTDFEKWSLAENESIFKRMVEQPLIFALSSPEPETAIELLERGADPNVLIKERQYSWGAPRPNGGCALDIYQQDAAQAPARHTLPEGIDTYLDRFEEGTYQYWVVSRAIDNRRNSYEQQLEAYEKQRAAYEKPLGDRRKEAAIAEAILKLEKAPSQVKNKQEPFTYDFTFCNVSDVTETRQSAYLKLNDWAKAGRNRANRHGGTEKSPLLIAASASKIETVKWFLSDTPLRQYLAFANSKGARDDARLEHLAQTPGGVEGAISKWLNDQTGQAKEPRNWWLTWLGPGHSWLMPRQHTGSRLFTLLTNTADSNIAKILIEAGADQETKDRKQYNLLHAALRFERDVRKLIPMLDLLDHDTLVSMIKERNGLEEEEGGQKPLHFILCRSLSVRGNSAKDVIRMIKMFLEISTENTRQAFRMLDGAGDTPLHTLLLNGTDPAIIRAIVDFDPSLLYLENAVGRTPAEVAHDRYLAHFIKIKEASIQHKAKISVASLTTTNWKKFATSLGNTRLGQT